MNVLLLLPLAFPFACLALLSLIAFLGVVVLGGAFYVVRAIKSGLGLAGRGSDGGEDPWRGMAGDAHPLDDIEGQHLARSAGRFPPTKSRNACTHKAPSHVM
jgi:hypothetical protein